MNFSATFEELEPPRLRLLAPKDEQASDIFTQAKNPNVSEYLTWYPHKTIEDSLWFLNNSREKLVSNEAINWIIQEKESQVHIGSIGLMSRENGLEIGYWIGEDFWGKGVVSEALQTVISFARKHAIEEIFGQHTKENIGSGEVMMKCGFVYQGNLFLERKGVVEEACKYILDLRKE